MLLEDTFLDSYLAESLTSPSTSHEIDSFAATALNLSGQIYSFAGCPVSEAAASHFTQAPATHVIGFSACEAQCDGGSVGGSSSSGGIFPSAECGAPFSPPHSPPLSPPDHLPSARLAWHGRSKGSSSRSQPASRASKAGDDCRRTATAGRLRALLARHTTRSPGVGGFFELCGSLGVACVAAAMASEASRTRGNLIALVGVPVLLSSGLSISLFLASDDPSEAKLGRSQQLLFSVMVALFFVRAAGRAAEPLPASIESRFTEVVAPILCFIYSATALALIMTDVVSLRTAVRGLLAAGGTTMFIVSSAIWVLASGDSRAYLPSSCTLYPAAVVAHAQFLYGAWWLTCENCSWLHAQLHGRGRRTGVKTAGVATPGGASC